MLKSLLAISLGASFGASLRWGLGICLNFVFPHIPLGTLVANLAGGFLMGIALRSFESFSIDMAWRLFFITGFLGSLTTFSTFSAEVLGLLQQQRTLWAMGLVSLHVCGSLAMTFGGIMAFNACRALWR